MEFPSYSVTHTERDEANRFLKRSVVWLARLYVWVGTVSEWFAESEIWGWHWQMLHTEKYEGLILLEMERSTGNVPVSVKYWAEEELVSKPIGRFWKFRYSVEWREIRSSAECLIPGVYDEINRCSRAEMKVAVVVLQDRTIQLQSREFVQWNNFFLKV